MSRLKYFLYLIITTGQIHSSNLCTSANFEKFCKIKVPENRIDWAIGKTPGCEIVYLWIPNYSAHLETNCYICANLNWPDLTKKSKSCGKVFRLRKDAD